MTFQVLKDFFPISERSFSGSRIGRKLSEAFKRLQYGGELLEERLRKNEGNSSRSVGNYYVSVFENSGMNRKDWSPFQEKSKTTYTDSGKVESSEAAEEPGKIRGESNTVGISHKDMRRLEKPRLALEDSSPTPKKF